MVNQAFYKQDKNHRAIIRAKIGELNTNGKKTIVYFNDTYYPIIDGVIKVVENYARIMSERYNVVLIVPNHKGMSPDDEDFLIIGSNAIFFSFVNYDLAFPAFDRYLSNALNHLRIDIIHAHSPFTLGKYASKLAKKRKVPFVMTIHSQFRQDFKRYLKTDTLTEYALSKLIKVFNKSTEVWAMHHSAEDMIRDYGYRGRIYHMPNATDFKTTRTKEELSSSLNQKYSLSKDLPVFLFVGRLIEQKNIFFIVDSLKTLKDNGLDFKMFFVGNGPDEDRLKEKVIKLDLCDRVIFTGRIEDREELAEYYARSDLFLFPSVYDTSSIVQIEAATLNTPVVFLKDTITSATVTDKVNGFIAERSVEDFARVVQEAITDKELLLTVSENAHRDLYLTWEMLANRVADRYEYLIEENKNTLRDPIIT